MLRKSIFFYSVSGKNPSEKLTKNRFYYNINVKFLMEERILKTKKLLSLFLAALMVFSFSGCEIIEDITKFTGLVSEIFEDNKEQEEPDEEPEIIVPDDPNWPANAFGITLEKAPEKVAVASPALAEYISDMGLFEKICAAADFCGFPGAEEKPSIGSVSLPDMEAIKTAAPEYILTFAQYEESLLIELQQMNVTVVEIKAPKSLEELRNLYRHIAVFFMGAVDGTEFGENYVSEYDSALAEIAYSGEQKTAAFIRALDYIMVTGDTMEQELLSAAGIKNAAEGCFGYSFPEESWADFDPPVLFVNSHIHLIDLETSDLYKKKSAVKGDKVYNVDIDVLAIGSRRSFEIIKDILATLYEDYTGGTVLEPAYPSMYKS